MVEVKRIIIHELQKEPGNNQVNSIPSVHLTEVSDNSIELVNRLNQSYTKDKILYALFDEEEDKYFPKRFANYFQSDRNDGGFIEFSRSAMKNLETIIRKKTLAKGGYLIFAEYANHEHAFTSIFLVRDTTGLIFHRNPKEENFSISTVEYLDTDKLAMACRINHNIYEDRSDRYLSFTKHKQRALADYFTEWICITHSESSKEMTETLYEVVNKLEAPINPETGKEYSIDEFRKGVYDYIKTQPGRIVDLDALGQHFYQDKNKVLNFIDQNHIPLNHEFKCDTGALRKFIRLEVNKAGINLKFSRGDLGKRVKLSENRKMVIIESKEFVEAFIKEMEDTENG